MNVRKPTDYSALFAVLDELMAAHLTQMELYRGIGRVVSGRSEKGAAVAAAEYLQDIYPDAAGFSPRSLRRMRDFYRTYESAPEVMAETMTIGWMQNVVIMKAELTLQEKAWYIRAVRQFGWSKLELTKQIAASAHLDKSLDLRPEVYYTEKTVIQAVTPAKCKLMKPNVNCAVEMARRLTRSDYDEYVLLIGMGRPDPLDTHRTFGGDVGGSMCRRLLCYGDSNTYGYDPRFYLGGRYPESVRWTALLNAEDWEVIENSSIKSGSFSCRQCGPADAASGRYPWFGM